MLCGSGPSSWWSGGVHGAGIADLVANIYEWEDCRLEWGLYRPKAYLNGATTAGDTTLIYDDNAGGDGTDICQLSPGTYTITDAVNGDEDVVIERVIITGRFSGIAVLSAGMATDHGDNCLIQLKTALDVTSQAQTGLGKGVGAYKTIYELLDDATGKYMALPDFSVTSGGYPTTYLDSGYAYDNEDSRALQRCGSWSDGSYARSGLLVSCASTPALTHYRIGFRAALSIGNQ
jgi:hypothetical protein